MASDVRQRKAQRSEEEEDQPPATSPAEPSRGPAKSGRSGLLLPLGLVILGVTAWKCCTDYRRAEQENALKSLGKEGLFLFTSFDINNDLYLSPEEFKPLAEKLTGVSQAPAYVSDEETDPNAEMLTIEAAFQPLILETMTKSKDGFLGVSHGSLSGLRNWKSAEMPSGVFSTSLFKAFLPQNNLELGEAWWIIPNELTIFSGYLSNNRFYPPTPQGREVLIHKLLSMFHPRPFVKTRFAPQGAVACTRAVSHFYYDIVFRIHGEFQLNEPPDFPFWFTPGQFTGHVILSKDASHVRDFWMYVPNDRSLNVDMEWLYGTGDSGNMEVDIGYLPQVGSKLFSTAFQLLKVALEEIRIPDSKINNHRIKDSQQGEGSGRTLRETVLESSPVLSLLNESFVSSWSLVKELEELQSNQENEEHAQLASLHLKHYNFPVEMMIALPRGKVVHHINANYFLDVTSMKQDEMDKGLFTSSRFEDPSTAAYVRFLKEGLEKAKQPVLS